MRTFEIRFLGGPFDGGRCRLSTPPPDVLYLPIQPDLAATVPLYFLTLVACSGAYGLSEYELDIAAPRGPAQQSIVLNYRARRLMGALRARPRLCDELPTNGADREASPSSELAVATPWGRLKRSLTRRKVAIKRWLQAPARRRSRSVLPFAAVSERP